MQDINVKKVDKYCTVCLLKKENGKMYKQKLCLGASKSFPLPLCEQFRLFKKVGFDGMFYEWSKGDPTDEYKKVCDGIGLEIQSLHAPFGKTAALWHGDEEKAEEALNELIECVEACRFIGAPIAVVHAFIGFDEHSPTKTGLKRFEKLVAAAETNKIKIAFENTEGEEYLAALMEHFKGNETVGFCWDTGHEMCYNRSKDMAALYGDRLIATHLNDNLGIRDFDGKITWLDDLHLLPFDGIADWDGIAARLDKTGFDGIMTFELNRASKPDRYDNKKYEEMPFELWVSESYNRACRVAAKRKSKQRG